LGHNHAHGLCFPLRTTTLRSADNVRGSVPIGAESDLGSPFEAILIDLRPLPPRRESAIFEPTASDLFKMFGNNSCHPNKTFRAIRHSNPEWQTAAGAIAAAIQRGLATSSKKLLANGSNALTRVTGNSAESARPAFEFRYAGFGAVS
jgi:hypothetical protein